MTGLVICCSSGGSVTSSKKKKKLLTWLLVVLIADEGAKTGPVASNRSNMDGRLIFVCKLSAITPLQNRSLV